MVKIAVVLPSPAFTPVGGNKIIYEYLNRLVNKDKKLFFSIYYDNSICSSKNFARIYMKYLISKVYPFWNWFEFNDQAKKHIKHMPVLKLKSKYLQDYHLIIVTSVETAIKVSSFNLPVKKLYFIQHYEDWNVSEEELHKSYRYRDFINIVVSKWLKSKVESAGGKVELYLPNSIDHNKFYMEVKPEDREPYTVGLMYHKLKWKGTEEGLKSLSLVKDRIPDLRVIMFGKFPKPKGLPSWITYHYNPSQDELRKIYNTCAVFLSPSYKEGFGLPPAEAIACGCAVIATRSGGVEDFCIDGKTALLCTSPPNPYELKEKICFLLKCDDYRISLAYKGYSYIKKNFSWTKNIELLHSLIKTLLT
ncbi:glycosyltransferase family 4 protein [Desulfurobacterium sp.]